MANISNIRKDYRSVEAKSTKELNNKVSEVKIALYTMEALATNLVGKGEFIAYLNQLRDSLTTERQAEFDAAVNSWDGTAENFSKLYPTCMQNAAGQWCILADVKDADNKKVLCADYVEPTYVKYTTKKGETKYKISPNWEEKKKFQDALTPIKEWKFEGSFRKMMEQGWRYNGVAQNAKAYSLTDEWVAAHAE